MFIVFICLVVCVGVYMLFVCFPFLLLFLGGREFLVVHFGNYILNLFGGFLEVFFFLVFVVGFLLLLCGGFCGVFCYCFLGSGI